MRFRTGFVAGIGALTLCSATLAATSGVAGAVSPRQAAHGSVAPDQPPELATFNWTGYIQDGQPGEFDAVSDTWTVPTVNHGQSGDLYSQQIIGIGGYGSDTTLIEVGTDADSFDGKKHIDSFYQLGTTGGSETLYPFKIHAGDKISASIVLVGTNEWQITFRDLTYGYGTSSDVDYSSSQETAEVALDRPCLTGNCEVNAINYAGLAQTSDITFPKGKVMANGSDTYVPLMSTIDNSTLDYLFMKNYDMDEIIACASTPSPNNKGFAAADGNEEPPPPSR
jgi:Peptidase A4 family